ncbi:phospholipid-transporting ATPase ABCA3-like [Ornithodoros turicata]|uniref:phospholipid-transporting ATPase ABCA3-like n=1 Tax=Ornithodoros turicata TaxID=34597 RepID=UPI00313958FF
MDELQQFYALLWKNVYVQTLQRHYLSTALEVIFVAVCFAYFKQEKPPTEWLHDGIVTLPDAKPTQWTVVNHVDSIVYGPADRHKKFLVDVGLAPYTYEGSSSDATTTEQGHRFPAANIHAYGTQEAVEKSCAPSNSSLCFFVNSRGWSFDMTSYTTVWSDTPRRMLELGLNGSSSTESGFKYPGINDRIIAFNIPNAHLNWAHRGKRSRLRPVYTRAFPPIVLPKNVDPYRPDFGLLLAAAFLLPFCLRISTVVAENSSGTKARLEGMGVSVFWLSHGVSCFLVLFASGVMASILLRSWPHRVHREQAYNLSGTLQSPGYYYVLPHVSWSVLLATFFMFSCVVTVHALAVASCTKWPSVAAAVGAAYWVFVANAIPYHFYRPRTASLHGYLFTSRPLKLAFCVFPCLATEMVLRIAAMEQDFNGSADWSIVNRPVLQLDNVTILQIWAVMTETFVFLSLWVWYFSKVLYWVTDVPFPFLFPFMVEYWFPKCKPSPQLSGDGGPGRSNGDTPTIIEIRELSKNFGTFPVLEDINLNVFNKKITVFLGHNGAGKTTLVNILAGVLPPTSGTARVCGFDVVQDSAAVQNCVSVCPQDDILYSDLTVYQHLYYFGQVRGMSCDTLFREIHDVLALLGLTEMQNVLPHTLSGGMRRRLSIAIATLYPGEVLILDEPTSCLDPAARSELWTILLSLRLKRSMLLTTHSMEEAYTLADHMTILVKGKVACWGTPTFLRAIFSGGYEVHMEKDVSMARVQEIMEIIEQTCPDVRIKSETPTELRIALGSTDCEGFDVMFSDLEQKAFILGIRRMILYTVSIEEAFVNVNLRETTIVRGENITVPEDVEVILMHRARQPKALQRIRALITKRVMNYWRAVVPFMLGALLPVVVLLAVIHQKSRQFDALFMDTDEHPKEPHKLSTGVLSSAMVDYYPDGEVFLHYDTESTELANNYCLPVLLRDTAQVDVLTDPSSDLLRQIPGVNLRGDAYKYVLGISIKQDRVEAWWNPYFPYSELISTYIAFTVLLRATTGDIDANVSMTQKLRVALTNGTVLLPLEDNATDAEEDMLIFAKGIGLVQDILPHVSDGSALIASSAVVFIIHERASASKSMQLMTGVPAPLFWLSSFLFDAAVAMTTWIILGIVYALHFDLLPGSAAALLALTSAFTAASTNTVYVLSYFVDKQYAAYAGAFIFFSVSGHIIATVPEGVVRSFMLVLPGSALREGLRKILALDIQNRECLSRSAGRVWWCPIDNNLVDSYQGLAYCCEHENATSDIPALVNPFSFETDLGIITELVFMIVGAICLFAWISILDSAWNYVADNPPNIASVEPNVEAERQLIQGLVAKKSFLGYSAVVHGLYKSYMPSMKEHGAAMLAVRGLSFTVKPGECFGLLGESGAGKSTTFRMLAGALRPSSGDAYSGGVVMSEDLSKWRARIGYCLQGEGLLDMMTATEILYLLARLRGVPEDSIARCVQAVVRLVDLEKRSGAICRSLSRSNKRKLSIAMSLVGIPPLVLLDEPTSGLDVYTRRRILASVSAIKSASGMSLLITSHDMDECEAICDRIAIMQAGQLRCLGNLIELKSTYGNGYLLSVAVPSVGGDARVDEAVLATFQTDVLLKEVLKDNLIYHLSDRLTLSKLFVRINYLRQQYDINNVLVSCKSLEDIFMLVTRTQ